MPNSSRSEVSVSLADRAHVILTEWVDTGDASKARDPQARRQRLAQAFAPDVTMAVMTNTIEGIEAACDYVTVHPRSVAEGLDGSPLPAQWSSAGGSVVAVITISDVDVQWRFVGNEEDLVSQVFVEPLLDA